MKRPLVPWPLRRFAHLRRRSLAALAAAVAVLATLSAFAPRTPELVPVVALAHDLPGGSVLADGDLTTVWLPPEAVPAGAATDRAGAVGQTLSGPASARTPVTDAGLAIGQQVARPGFVVVAVPLTDGALAPLVRPGGRLDLLSAGGDGEVIARDVRVVAVPAAEASGFGTTSSRSALLEVSPEVATRLAVASQTGGVAIALR